MSDCNYSWDMLQKAINQLSTTDRLRFIEEVARSLQFYSVAIDPKQQKVNLERLCHELATMPIYNPADGFSGSDHDRLLY